MVTLFTAGEVDALADDAEIVELFGGPGGWSQALRLLGHRDGDVGIERDRWACATRRAAGFSTIEADVLDVDPARFAAARGLIASPPCQALSDAGKKHGVGHRDALVDAINRRDWDFRPDRDPNVWLSLQVGRWVEAIRPTWVVLEQVRAAMPLWEAFADMLAADGYFVAAMLVNAADYGVPQIRRRAVLIASLERDVDRPTPTHCNPAKQNAELLPWVTMADALGWGAGTDPTVATGRDWRPDRTHQTIDASSQPAPTLTALSGSQWHLHGTGRAQGAEAPEIAPETPPEHADSDVHDVLWPFSRPSTPIAGDARCFAPGGHRANDGRDNSRTIGRSDHAIMLEIDQALTLQSFPRCYPVQGPKSLQFIQVGNAVPPLLGAHLLAEASPALDVAGLTKGAG